MKLNIILIVCLTFFSCKNSTSVNSDKESTTKTLPQNTNNEVLYDIIISFTSMGEGIDYALRKEVDAEILNFNNEHNLTIQPQIVHWGREGEADYNILLKNLSTSQKKKFISSLKEMVGISELTLIYLNQKAVHKR
ncbi:MAG: hypothetical protein J5I47_00135 [Vicingus serpentipes]|nr:hypothetical protein [Vicingus serpentipes]